jgi:phage-related protein
VREWLLALSISERRLIGEDIKCVEFGWPIGLPVCRPIGKGIFEVRTTLPTGRISRVLFCVHEDHMILLHGFIKKTQSTPKAEIELARKRMRGLT